MVFGIKPECSKCQSVESLVWNKNENEDILCLSCFEQTESNSNPRLGFEADKVKGDDDNEKLDNSEPLESRVFKEEEECDIDQDKETCKISDKKDPKRKVRKGKQGGKSKNIPRGKGRRYIFKKSATKSPVAVATPVTSDYLFYQGNYYQVGDIVSVIDVEGGTYYAQIRGLLQDQYCEKSAVLTWLLPTKNSPPPEKKFDPSTYIIGPEEEIPRKLEYLHFECHAPSDYFKDQSSPYATISYKPESCYVWTRLGPIIKPMESATYDLSAK